MRKIVTDKIEKVSIFNASSHELPVVISIPHSGLYVTNDMNNSLLKEVVLANMDWYLPDLYDFLKDLGFTVIVNNISRYVVDVNRDINASKDYEDKYTNSLVYMLNTFGKPMYKNKLNKEEIDYRIFKFYQPFHEALQNALNEKLKHFSKVYLFDLHSFAKEVNADVVLGNNFGSTLDDETTNLVRDLFGQNGFKVALNKPYKGGFITKHYGKKDGNVSALQIELAYKEYIDNRIFDEEEMPNVNFEVMQKCQDRLKKIFLALKNTKFKN